MRRWLGTGSALALLGVACTPAPVGVAACDATSCGEGRVCHEGSCVDTCVVSGDCRPGHVCEDGMCLEGQREVEAACAAPEVAIVVPSGEVDVYAGLEITLLAQVSHPDPACSIAHEWWMCGAPAGSTYDDGGPDLCHFLAADETLVLAVDLRGTYRVRLVGFTPDSVSSADLEVHGLADPLLVEVSYADTGGIADTVRSLSAAPCWGLTSSPCTADPLCAWNLEQEVCWPRCEAIGSEAACLAAGTVRATGVDDQTGALPGARFMCTWENGACGPGPILGMSACVGRGQATCEDLSSCAWWPQAGACALDCDIGECFVNGCSTNGARCVSPGEGVGMPVPALLDSDGGELTFIRTNRIGYRYDPNGRFPRTAVSNGASARVLGAAALPSDKAVVLPYQYLVDAAAYEGLCLHVFTLLVWQGGDIPGLPETLEDLTTVRTNIEGISTAPPIPVLPSLTRVGEALYVAYVEQQATDTLLANSCHAQGEDYYEAAFRDVNGVSAGLSIGGAWPLYVARLDPGGLLAGPLTVGPGVYPCRSDADCRAGSCAPAGGDGHCDQGFAVWGVQARIQPGGEGLLFVHVPCGGQTSCGPGPGAPPTLVGARIAPTADGFEIVSAQHLVSGSAHELADPIWVGAFPESGALIYIERTQLTHAVSVDSPSGYVPVTLAQNRILQRTVLRAGDGWIVGAPLIIDGGGISGELAPEPTLPCVFGDVTEVTENQVLTFASQPALSPDQRYLAYLQARHDYQCKGNDQTRRVTWDGPYASDVFVVDLETAPEAPFPAYPEACRPELLPFVTMPTFIAGGRQLAFNNTDGVEWRLLRVNVDALGPGAAVCPLTRLADSARVAAALDDLVPNPQILGVAINDSRIDYLYGDPSCGATASAWVWLLSLVVLGSRVLLARRGGRR